MDNNDLIIDEPTQIDFVGRTYNGELLAIYPSNNTLVMGIISKVDGNNVTFKSRARRKLENVILISQ
jgi:hypothetical protein